MIWFFIIFLQVIPIQTLPDISLSGGELNRKIKPEKDFYTETCSEISSNKNISIDIGQRNLNFMRQSIEMNKCQNPDVAFTFIDRLIDNNAFEHYQFAEELYFLSLSTQPDKAEMGQIKDEAEKLLPLLPYERKPEWEDKIENGDPSLAKEIKKFWKLQDPVLSTPTNERLREHWQRVAYARQEFDKNKDGIYGSDDRGTIYIKLGPPTFKRSGMLFLDNSEIKSKLYDLALFKGEINPREIFNLQMSIKQQYMPRYYEVWVYRNLNSRRPALYIFGESAQKRTFGMRKSLEEFIPSGSYSMGISSPWRYNTGPRGLNAGPFLQMSLYNALSTVDAYFGNQLNEYERHWFDYLSGQLNFSALKTVNNPTRAEQKLRKIQEEAPEVKSDLTNNLDLIDQNYRVYRFLNENNEPVNKIMVFGTPHDKLIPNDALINEHQYPTYEMNHALRVFDDSGGQFYLDKADLVLKKNNAASNGIMLKIPAYRSDSEQFSDSPTVMLSSEVRRIPATTENQNIRKKIVIASSVEKIAQPKPLNSNPGTFEVSDIIWGYESDQKDRLTDELPFTIPAVDKLPEDKNLMIYFETYHLKADLDSLFNYRVEYSIHRKKRWRTIDTGIKLTLNFSSASTGSKENIEIKTTDLEPSKYRALFRFSVPGDSAEPKERTIDFEIE